MRILVLGGEGMLGHKMFQTLSERYPDTFCSIRGKLDDAFYRDISLFTAGAAIPETDIMDWPAVSGQLRESRPDYVVNCIGIVKQRAAAHEAIPSITINSLLPHQLAHLLEEWGGRLIHFSTDCVFDGHTGSYTETSPSNAEDLYGRSKYLGEVAYPNALTLRTSIIGRELAEFKSLLEWFLRNGGGKVKGYRRVIYAGVTTNYMAQLVANLITDHPTLAGLYQVTSPPIDKYDLLCRLKEAYKLDLEIEPDDDMVSDRSMIGDKFLAATGYSLPEWSGLIDQLVGDPTPYDAWRGSSDVK